MGIRIYLKQTFVNLFIDRVREVRHVVEVQHQLVLFIIIVDTSESVRDPSQL